MLCEGESETGNTESAINLSKYNFFIYFNLN